MSLFFEESVVLAEKRREGKQREGEREGREKAGRSYPHYLQMTWAKRRTEGNGWTEMSEAGNV